MEGRRGRKGERQEVERGGEHGREERKKAVRLTWTGDQKKMDGAEDVDGMAKDRRTGSLRGGEAREREEDWLRVGAQMVLPEGDRVHTFQGLGSWVGRGLGC